MDTPTKLEWKNLVKQAVMEEVKKTIEQECQAKSTLRFLNPLFNINSAHISVSSTKNPRDVTRSNIKLRMLTGTYNLESTQYTFRRVKTDLCRLCKEETEDITHMLLRCKTLSNITDQYMLQIHKCIPYVYSHRSIIFRDKDLTTQLILDPTHPSIALHMPLTLECYKELEMRTRNLCFALHSRRANILSQMK
jgi:hypothetical protein